MVPAIITREVKKLKIVFFGIKSSDEGFRHTYIDRDRKLDGKEAWPLFLNLTLV